MDTGPITSPSISAQTFYDKSVLHIHSADSFSTYRIVPILHRILGEICLIVKRDQGQYLKLLNNVLHWYGENKYSLMIFHTFAFVTLKVFAIFLAVHGTLSTISRFLIAVDILIFVFER